ncbi:unnamed protein product [Polarella glacialis]|uniref:Secreted protein n=1 Tax=Polarella glacialis TaxID=89957 RepID=A0A813FWB5_POLGL|nr:unnamed protein product [Polarella glacialis]
MPADVKTGIRICVALLLLFILVSAMVSGNPTEISEALVLFVIWSVARRALNGNQELQDKGAQNCIMARTAFSLAVPWSRPSTAYAKARTGHAGSSHKLCSFDVFLRCPCLTFNPTEGTYSSPNSIRHAAFMRNSNVMSGLQNLWPMPRISALNQSVSIFGHL